MPASPACPKCFSIALTHVFKVNNETADQLICYRLSVKVCGKNARTNISNDRLSPGWVCTCLPYVGWMLWELVATRATMFGLSACPKYTGIALTYIFKVNNESADQLICSRLSIKVCGQRIWTNISWEVEIALACRMLAGCFENWFRQGRRCLRYTPDQNTVASPQLT